MSLYVNGATNFTTVYANGVEARTIVSNGTTVYVKTWVTFDEQGGSAVSDRYVWYGRSYTQYAALPVPTRSGYTFSGWFTSTFGAGAQITTGTLSTTTNIDQTLYAYWISANTTTPDITYTYDPVRTRYTIRVYNRDPDGAASIWSEVGDSTPDILRSSSVAYNSYTQWLYTSGFSGFTIYATAQVSGKPLSAVRSVYVS